MAQGKKKAPKVQIPGASKKPNKKSIKQKQGVSKKGGGYIAPKKKKLIEAGKLKQSLEKGIRTCIEEELTQKTKALEPKSLSMLKSTPSSSGSKKNKS